MRVLVAGSLAYDRILNFEGVFADHMIPDRMHQLNVSFYAPKLKESYGGCAGNMAYSLALLKDEPAILARVGNDFARYGGWLDTHGVDTSTVEIDGAEVTASATIITDQKDNQIAAFHPGAMNKPYSLKKQQASFAIIGPTNPDDMRAMPGWFRDEKIPFLFDPGQQIPTLSGDDLKNGILGSKGLISNDYELALILEKTGMEETEILNTTDLLITTYGAKGSRIRTKDETIDIPPARPKNIDDPTGAGDAYRAGFVHGLLQGWPLPVAGRLAGLVSAYTVETYGTQTHTFTAQELRNRYRENFDDDLPN